MAENDVARKTEPRWQTQRLSRAGGVMALTLVVGLGGWSVVADLDGAVIAPGEVRLASNRQIVQHRFGGVVAEILARDHDHVKAGDVVLRMNDTELRAKQAITQRELDEARGELARLRAEREDSTAIEFAHDLRDRAENEPALQAILETERALLKVRRKVHQARQEELKSRLVQLEVETAGLTEQIEAAQQEHVLLKRELWAQQQLVDKRLAPRRAATQLELEQTQLVREIAALTSSRAARGSEIEGVETAEKAP